MEHLTTRGRLALAILVILGAVVAPVEGFAAQPPRTPATQMSGGGAPRIEAGLTTTARARGTVRVVVRMRASVAPSAMRISSSRSTVKRQLRVRSNRVGSLARTTGGSVARRYRYLPYVVLMATPRTITALRASPDVASVAADRLSRPELDRSVPLVQGNTMAGAGWGGVNQIVAVLDTGVQADHPFLAGKVVDEACFASGGDPNQGDGIPGPTGSCPNGLQTDFGAGAAAPCTSIPDECLHGTHVAGIAVGRRLVGAGPGHSTIAGVARSASLLPIQVFSTFDPIPGDPFIGSWSSDQAAGLEYVYAKELAGAYAPKHVASVNLSIGGDATSLVCDNDPTETLVRDAALHLRMLKVATIYAAGNDGYVNATSFPACLSTVITVSSTTISDHLSSFSNIASWVDLAAPGSDIYSSIPGGRFMSLSGTSMATPHVAGAWAEIKSRFPNASVDIVDKALQVTGVPVRDDRYTGSYVHLTKARIRVLSAGDWMGATTTALTSSATRVSSGTFVTLTATVARRHSVGQKPTGRVAFKVSGTTVARVTIDPDTGTATFLARITGAHGAKVRVQAFCKGAGPFLASVGPIITITIK
jgi:subtilisin